MVGSVRRAAVRAMAALVAIAALVGLPATAAAASTPTTSAAPTFNPAGPSSPFSPGVPQNPSQVPTTTTAPGIVNPTTTTPGDSSLSGGGVVGIAIGALALLGGISFFIWRDARRRAPVRHRAAAATADAGGRAGSKARTKPRKLSPAERKRRKRGRAR